MNRVRFYVLVSIALAVAVLVPSLGTHAQTQANPKVEFIHTGDWQSGDKVSFTIRGMVVDSPTPENNQQQPTQSQSAAGATLRGYVVDMEDPKGNKTQIPWKPLIEYSVPSVEGSITATLIGPGGVHVGTARIPVYNAGTSIPLQLPTQSSATLVAPPISQIGQPYKVYSPSGALSGHGDATLIAGGSPGSEPIVSTALAESPHSAVFEPSGLKPGPTTFTVKEGPALEASFSVSVIGIGLDTRRLQTRGQTGTLVLQVTGFPTNPDELHKLMASNPVVSLVNETPNILAFTQGSQQMTWDVHESEVQDGTWTQDIPTLAQQRGQFQMTATATTSALINPSSGMAQSEQPSPPATPNEEHNPPTKAGDEQFVSTEQTGGQNQKPDARQGVGGCPGTNGWMRGKLSLKNGDVYLTDESGVEVKLSGPLTASQVQLNAVQAQATAARLPAQKRALLQQAALLTQTVATEQAALKAAAMRGDTWYICFPVDKKANPANNTGLTVAPGYLPFPDNPKLVGDVRYVSGKVTKETDKDKGDTYWIVDERTGLKYQIVLGNNCDQVWKKPHEKWQKQKNAYDDYPDLKKAWDMDKKGPPPVKPPKPGPEPPEIEPNAVDVSGTIIPGKDGKTPTIECTPGKPAK